MKIKTENGNLDVFLRDVNCLKIQKSGDNFLTEYYLGVILAGDSKIHEVFGSRTINENHIAKMYNNFACASAEGFKGQKLKFSCVLNMLNVKTICNNEIYFKDGNKISVSSKALEDLKLNPKNSFYK